MLTKKHIASINQTMALLRDMEERSLQEVRYPYGKFGEACQAAEKALFNVLLISKHWFADESATTEEPTEVAS